MSSQFRDFILGKLILGDLNPGDELTPKDLMEQFASEAGKYISGLYDPPFDPPSRSAYRYAMESLANLRLVESTPGMGTRVTRRTIDYLRATSLMRYSLDTVAIAEVIRRLNASAFPHSVLLELERFHEQMVCLTRKDASWADTVAFVFRDHEFHRKIYELAGIAFNDSTFWTFIPGSTVKWKEKMSSVEAKRDVCREHWLILSWLGKRDLPSAAGAVRYHLISSVGRIDQDCATDIHNEMPRISGQVMSAEFDPAELKAFLKGIPVEPNDKASVGRGGATTSFPSGFSLLERARALPPTVASVSKRAHLEPQV